MSGPLRINIRLAGLGLLVAANVAGALHREIPDYRVQRRLAHIPRSVAGYQGVDKKFDKQVYDVLDTDDDLNRAYVREKTDFHWLYVGYYGSKKGGRTGHVPQHCFPGSGYQIVRSTKETFRTVQGTAVRVNRLLVEKDGVWISCLYWFQSGGEVYDSGWGLNWKRFRDRLTERKDDGAFVRVLSPAGPDGGSNERQRRFASEIVSLVADAWPEEVVVANAN